MLEKNQPDWEFNSFTRLCGGKLLCINTFDPKSDASPIVTCEVFLYPLGLEIECNWVVIVTLSPILQFFSILILLSPNMALKLRPIYTFSSIIILPCPVEYIQAPCII